MTLSRVWERVRWAAQIQVWTTGVTLAMAALLVVQLVSIPFGGASIPLSPRGTIEALYQASQDGDYDRAFNLLDTAGRAEVAIIGDDAWRAMVDDLSRGQRITEMTYGSQRNYGKHAVIGMLVTFDDDQLRAATAEIVRQGTVWRVMWPPGNRNFTETIRKYDPWFGY